MSDHDADLYSMSQGCAIKDAALSFATELSDRSLESTAARIAEGARHTDERKTPAVTGAGGGRNFASKGLECPMERDEPRISPNHPLRLLFQELVYRHLYDAADLHDAEVADYVSGVLTEFTRVDRLYPIRNIVGHRLEEVAELLVESNPLLDANSFDREREVRKHIGDFTLFLAGLFPEVVAALPRLRPLSPDTFVDYVAAGKKSYAVVAAFNLFEYRDEAPLFRRLSDSFERCVVGLNQMKGELEELQTGAYRHTRGDLD